MAFANFGGGYILIGVTNNKALKSISVELDPAQIGENIERNIGYSIKFDINYFDISYSNVIYRTGIVYIYPSTRLLSCPKDLHGEDGKKLVMHENDIYTRRNTRSIKANGDDVTMIVERITEKNKTIATNKLPILPLSLNAYFEIMVKKYEEPTLGDENISLDKLYIDPEVLFLKGGIMNSIEKTFSSLYEYARLFSKGKGTQLLIILGYPGQGKTSFCKFIS